MTMRERFLGDVLTNRNNRTILDRWSSLELPDGWLVAGCLFQTIWNLQSGFPPEARIRDYDLFYFDDTDVSSEAERQVQAHVDDLYSDLHVTIEAKNQARVHLWYPDYFGHPYPPLRAACDGIDRFLIAETCIGIRRIGSKCDVYAPNGLESVYGGTLSPNPLMKQSALYERKARSYTARWPWLKFEAAGVPISAIRPRRT